MKKFLLSLLVIFALCDMTTIATKAEGQTGNCDLFFGNLQRIWVESCDTYIHKRFDFDGTTVNVNSPFRSAVMSLTTTGSGAASWTPSTGVLNIPTPASIPATSINDSPGRSLVTTTSSTGFQISSTRNAIVNYEGTFQTTSTIGGPASVTVFLETANTNSTTPSDWTVIARQTNSNTITLAIALNQVDVEPWSISRTIPAGKYVRIRYGSITGTATATINTEQQETQIQ